MRGTIEDRWYRTTNGQRVQTTQYRKGLRWRVRYRASGVQRAKSFADYSDAQDFLNSIGGDIVTGSWVDPKRAKITVAAFAPTWLATTGHGKRSTRNFYDSLTRVHVLPKWGEHELGTLSHAEIAAWVGEMRQQMSASRTRHAFRALSLLLDLAVTDKRLPANPARGVKLPKAAKKAQHILTRAELEQLANEMDHPSYRALVLVLGLTGVRIGEAMAMKRDRLDLKRLRFRVDLAAGDDGGVLYYDTPKDDEDRGVPMPPELAELLAELSRGKRRGDLVLTAPKGGPIRYRNFRRDAWDAAVSAIGHDGLTPHDLRHTAASLAISAGADAKVVQNMLGHADAAMTLNIYADLLDSKADDVARRMSNGKSLLRAPVLPPRVSQCVPQRRLRVVKDDQSK